MTHHVRFNSQDIGPGLNASCDMKVLNSFFKCNDLGHEIKFLVSLCNILCPVQYFQALEKKSLFIKNMGIIKLLVELQVQAVCTFQKAETGHDLLVQVCFQVVKLTFFGARQFFK